MCVLLLRMVLSVCSSLFHNMVTVPLWTVSSNCTTCSYQCSFSVFTPVSLNTLNCSWAHILSCLLMYCFSLQTLGMLIQCGLLSHPIVDIVCICCLFLFAVSLLHNILFVMRGLVLLLLHFQFLLSGLFSTDVVVIVCCSSNWLCTSYCQEITSETRSKNEIVNLNIIQPYISAVLLNEELHTLCST